VSIEKAIEEFLHAQRLPEAFIGQTKQWFLPLAAQLAAHRQQANRPLTVGINGSQGSGKSTLAALLRLLLERIHDLRAIDLSIDDFYLTRTERESLAADVHPLLATRGVPGTHDIDLMRSTLDALTHTPGQVAIPRFDKAQDDRLPPGQWTPVESPLDMVIIEGWCLGVRAQSEKNLIPPVNRLEAQEDSEAVWRRHVNTQIAQHYEPLYERVDIWIVLQAPSFDSVYQWRLEQEQKLIKATGQPGSRLMTPSQLARFIQHYQRLTEHMLQTLPAQAHYLFRLDPQRRIIETRQPRGMSTR